MTPMNKAIKLFKEPCINRVSLNVNYIELTFTLVYTFYVEIYYY